jgi:hypothetical protein
MEVTLPALNQITPVMQGQSSPASLRCQFPKNQMTDSPDGRISDGAPTRRATSRSAMSCSVAFQQTVRRRLGQSCKVFGLSCGSGVDPGG